MVFYPASSGYNSCHPISAFRYKTLQNTITKGTVFKWLLAKPKESLIFVTETACLLIKPQMPNSGLASSGLYSIHLPYRRPHVIKPSYSALLIPWPPISFLVHSEQTASEFHKMRGLRLPCDIQKAPSQESIHLKPSSHWICHHTLAFAP